MLGPKPPPEFRWAALMLADRLDALKPEQFMTRSGYVLSGYNSVATYQYDRTATEWIEFMTPYGQGDREAYEAVARRGWANAQRIATADWDECLYIASVIIRAQITRSGPVLGDAHQQGMLSGLLRRMADLVEVEG